MTIIMIATTNGDAKDARMVKLNLSPARVIVYSAIRAIILTGWCVATWKRKIYDRKG
jgi:hypothetical protein